MLSQKLIGICTRNFANQTCSGKIQSPLMKSVLCGYNSYFPKIIDQSLEKVSFVYTPAMRERIKKCSEYYIIGRNPVQGEFMVLAYEALNKDLIIDDEMIHKLQVIVTTVEMVQTYFFFWDDLEDKSTTRLGKPCWHLLEDTGLFAFTDACIMRSFINDIVRQNFHGEMCANILSVYDKVYFTSSVGQYMEATISRSRNYDYYTMESYTKIGNLRSSFYSVKSPLLLGLALNNKLNKESYDVVDDVGLDIGVLVQCHNDLIDYFSEKGKLNIGKSGTDIQEGKFSWVATTFLENCNSEQKRIFAENYGSADPDKVKRIIELYEEVDVAKHYQLEQQKRFDVFNEKVSKLPKNATPSAEFFKSFQNLFHYYSQDITNLMYDKH